MKLNFAEHIQAVDVLSPQDITSTATGTQYIEMANIGGGQLEFAIQFGTITATDSTGSVTVTVEASSDGGTDTSPTAIAFNYRLSSAVGTDSNGAITAATSSGVSVAGTDDDKMLLVYVDPAVSQLPYVRAKLTPVDAPTATLVSAQARFVPRFAQNSLKSSS